MAYALIRLQTKSLDCFLLHLLKWVEYKENALYSIDIYEPDSCEIGCSNFGGITHSGSVVWEQDVKSQKFSTSNALSVGASSWH